MIYTFGCSFTKWYWHTWSDWLEEYLQEPVTNLGWIGLSNENIYWELVSRRDTINSHDTVYIMLTGNNRVSMWYDQEWIEKNDCKGFFPNNNEKLEFGAEPWHGMYRLHPDHDASLTHMIVDNFNIIYQIQALLKTIGCKYRMIFWQNPWYDTRPKLKPIWQSVWPVKNQLTKDDISKAQAILKLRPVANLLNLIDWNKFYFAPTDPLDPEKYFGFWEYKIKKQTTEEFMLYMHDDPHPDTVIHHDFCTEIILDHNQIPTHRSRAIEYAHECLKHSVVIPRDTLITNNYAERIKKMY